MMSHYMTSEFEALDLLIQKLILPIKGTFMISNGTIFKCPYHIHVLTTYLIH